MSKKYTKRVSVSGSISGGIKNLSTKTGKAVGKGTNAVGNGAKDFGAWASDFRGTNKRKKK
jgi:hypothetical protein